MFRELLPKMYLAYERSHLAVEYYEFAAWLREAGYTNHLICRHRVVFAELWNLATPLWVKSGQPQTERGV